ncbi:MAG: tryptophan 2,3-dioxygenase family protein [Gemmatimonadaceae bacterium]|nr:tryptophan 2,3-dioxygenase family protein [Gemmatimonadaceae bacterium]
MSATAPTPPGDPTAGQDAGPTYGSYLALDTLLQLQHPLSDHPDELLFIVVHQSSELWFKVILFEQRQLVRQLEAGDAERALWHVERINRLMRIVSEQLASLDTLPPQRFAEFRGHLGTSSGQQSLQFRILEAASGRREPAFVELVSKHGPIPPEIQEHLDAPTLEARFLALLAREQTPLEALYTGPGPGTLYFLAEALLAFEQEFARWRFLHMQLVERILGPMTSGTGGTLGAGYLHRTTALKFFPELWRVRQRFHAPTG